jgi:serine/threonine-protein kinase
VCKDKRTVLVVGVGASLALAQTAHPQQIAPTRAPPSQLVRFAIVPPAAQPLRVTNDRDLAISRDGTHLVYIAGAYGQPSQLMVRVIDQLDAAPLRGITAPRSPFFSPDGRWIGFYAQGEIRKVSITGGQPITLCRTAGAVRGANWGPNDTIVFATDSAGTGLFSVPAGGGEPRALTTPAAEPAQAGATFRDGEAAHQFPSVLPSGRAVLFTIRANGPIDTAQVAVAVLDLNTGRRRTLIRGGSQAEYVEPGYLVYAAAGTLRAVRFDLARQEVRSDPLPVAEHVMTKEGGAANFSVSQQGTLVYVPGGAGGQASQPNALLWVNRQGGVEEQIQMPPHSYSNPRLSPDGTRVALGIRDPERGYHDLGIGVWDLARETLTPLTFRDIAWPVWTPDGRRIVFASELGTGGAANLFSQAADGTGPVERLTTSPNKQDPHSISPDGRILVLGDKPPWIDWNLSLLAMDGPQPSLGAANPRIEPLIATTANEINAEISPDGRWLAYQSDESGRNEVYVRPFPRVDDGRWQITTAGGTTPLWARSGRELFYLDASGFLTTVPVQTTPAFSAGDPTRVLFTPYHPLAPSGPNRMYDVSPDGQRFLMIKDAEATMVVVLNWLQELERPSPRN